MQARVAAIVVSLGGISVLLLILGRPGANSAFAGMQQSLEEVRSVMFTVSSRRGDEPAEVVNVKLLGKDLGRAEHDSDGTFTVFDRKQRKMMKVTPDDRKVTVLTNVEGENPIPNLFDMLLTASKRSVEELGEKEFDGKTLRGFVTQFRGQKLDVWVDPVNNLPMRLEERHQPNSQPIVRVVFDKFVYNSKLEPAHFRIEPPDGYQVELRELHSVEEHARRAAERDRQALQRAREAAEKRRAEGNP